MFCQPMVEGALQRRAVELARSTSDAASRSPESSSTDDHRRVGRPTARPAPLDSLVGCDGANSSGAQDGSICRSTDLGFFYDWLIVDVILDEPRVFDPLNLQICDPARPTTAVSGGPGRRRWEFMKPATASRSTTSTTRSGRGSCWHRGM
jgi:flavoprotein hydroxylase